MRKFPDNWDPTLFTLSAVAVGALFLDDYTANEQNSIGNWLILVGQTILTNAAQQVLINGRMNNNPNVDPQIAGTNNNYNNDFNSLKKAIDRINQELNKY